VRSDVDLAVRSAALSSALTVHEPSGPSGGPPTRESTLARLLAFARVLQDVTTFSGLLEASRAEVEATTGYAHAWLMVKDETHPTRLRLLETASSRRKDIWEAAPILDSKGDRFIEEVIDSRVPVVIPDARIDPRTNKEMVARLENRTLINIPLLLVDAPFGIFGVGTFGDEGPRPPSDDQVSYLVGMASQISVAASRLRWLEGQARADRERSELERRLAQVQKLESLGLLAGGIAHDFNNLLTVIISSAALADEISEEEAVRSEVRHVLEAAERAASLTRQLLAVNRSQSSSSRALDLNELLRQLLTMLRRILPETVSVELVEGDALPFVEGDRSQLEQVFMNLLINARDAMPDGGHVRIETERVLVNDLHAESFSEAKPGNYVRVTVTDTGVGMERETIEHIFEPFFTTKATKAGTGLGLAVSHGIVRQHEGMLQCDSQVGVGTVFKVYFPAALGLDAAASAKPLVAPAGGNARVLVAEDEAAVRAVVVRILERGGYAVESVDNGNAACMAVAHAAFDLVLMDVVMPGLSCREAVKHIRNVAPDARILLTSGYTAGESVRRLVEQTGIEILRKPYDPDQLLRAVRRAIDGRPPGGSSLHTEPTPPHGGPG
jgi:signal transduction histidine kinase/ActR/RegA family two-component response regulator